MNALLFPPRRGIDFAVLAEPFLKRAAARSLTAAVIGLGYVGLPLAEALVEAGFDVTAFDVDPDRIARLRDGASYIEHIADDRLGRLIDSGRFAATADPQALESAEAFVVCVPTPLDAERRPDLSHVIAAGALIAPALSPGSLVVLSSTVHPGATAEILRPELEASGLRAGRDFALAYSPEREDPGRARDPRHPIPRVLGADTVTERAMAAALFEPLGPVVPMPDLRTAEAVKLIENVFRLVNIAAVNELGRAFAALGIDTWAVIEAAATKPFGYMPFYPGPGVGGHCIPVDPLYLTAKAATLGVRLPLVERASAALAGRPAEVAGVVARALERHAGKPLSAARILLVGVAYKAGVGDVRESPALALLQQLEEQGAAVDFHDPHVPRLAWKGGERPSVAWSADALRPYDCAVIVTDHREIDYAELLACTPLVVDTRNATGGLPRPPGATVMPA